MSKLNDYQIDRLAESIKEHMHADQGFMWSVVRFYAGMFSLDDYNEWFQEPDPWEEFTLPLSFQEKADQEEDQEEETVEETKTYNIHDIIRVGYTLEPLICIHCGSSEVTYHPGVGDAHCADCGRWQLEGETE